MSRVLIQHYLNHLADLRRVSGTHRESVVREAFKDLLKGWARPHDLTFIPEYELETPAHERRYVDGALVDPLRVPFGYWEAKDARDDLDAEIAYKIGRGYPQDNIIFEDSLHAVLIQNKVEVMRAPLDDTHGLERLLTLFFGFERVEISAFRKAVEQFKTDLPTVLESLRAMIQAAYRDNPAFHRAAVDFLAHAREAINPNLVEADVREMLIQHILTEEIFSKVFSEDDFHRQNNVARKLYDLEGTFFTGDLKKRTLRGLDTYYMAIRAAAAHIQSHHEKQAFLKTIYENFYKVYNPKAADRLGVVYTPNEIVHFMVEGADRLCERHFGRNLADRNVEILDPAAGTGTFICELIEHFRGSPDKLHHKYREELHANEVAILPYYTANLNIEATYAAVAGEYVEFPNLCFVDTLDNTFGLRKYAGHQEDLFGSVSEENVERIRRQNRRKISVVIGNPPYNANQANENENNKNREYPEIDKRIKETYIAASTAQKTKLYDMYARFFRWASDRVDENGIVAFVSNRSFIDSRTFDGFRKIVAKEFSEIWIVDLKGNARTSGERRRKEGGNVFFDQIRVGVAVYFFVKKKGAHGCRIFYEAVRDYATAEEKIDFLVSTPLFERAFDVIRPDAKHNWINLTSNDFDTLIPLATKETKAAKKPSQEKAIFKLFSNGVNTARDSWVYDIDREALARKVRWLVEAYSQPGASSLTDSSLKWSRNLHRRKTQGLVERFTDQQLLRSLYRPFFTQWLYDSPLFIDERGSASQTFGFDQPLPNRAICLLIGGRQDFCAVASGELPNFNLYSLDSTQYFPRFVYQPDGERVENITDWGLEQFRRHYQPGRGRKADPITKEAIFHYVYAVLHDPVYREKYAQNLKRDFPRIPFYPDFRQWAAWGKELMELHLGYEAADPFPLTRADLPDDGHPPKALLKADKEGGRILVDSHTTLSGIPPEAWDYRLGNRSALEWILDQYKEKKPKDPTIREKFNTYRFADHKEKVIDLLLRVTTVSLRTTAITSAMSSNPR